MIKLIFCVLVGLLAAGLSVLTMGFEPWWAFAGQWFITTAGSWLILREASNDRLHD